MFNLVHPEKYEILDGYLRSEPLYLTRRDRGRPATRGVTTSSSALADALESEKPTLSGEGGGRHEEISLVIVPPMVAVLPTDEPILTNGAELEG